MLHNRRQFMASVAGATLNLSLLPGQSNPGSGEIDLPKKPNTREKAPERLLDVILVLDVEDSFSLPEVGSDDSVKDLAVILTQEGLRANFLFIGDCALLLKERGRRDVIESLAPHEVGLHTRSARHPTSVEYIAGKNWEEGVAEALKNEREGAEIIRTVFGKPCAALSGHSAYDSPHSQHCAAILGVPYVSPPPAAPPLYSVSWYAGALGLPSRSPTLGSQPFRAHFAFDENNFSPYPDTAVGAHGDTGSFYRQLRLLDEHIDTCLAEGQPFLLLFLYHSHMLRLQESTERFWAPNGVNYPKERWGEWGRPRPRTSEEVKTALLNFRRLARWVRTDPRLNVLSLTQVAERYGAQPTSITRQELFSATHAICEADDILFNPRFSPAEIVVGLARAAVLFADQGKVPSEVPRDNILGPTRSPIWVPELLGCTRDKLIQLSRQLLDHVAAKGELPGTLGAPLERVGVNHLYRALAENYVAMHSGSVLTELQFKKIAPWPPLAQPIGLTFLKDVEECPTLDPDLDPNTLYRDAKLQTWTLKPAIMP
jgi:hypothetical protein